MCVKFYQNRTSRNMKKYLNYNLCVFKALKCICFSLLYSVRYAIFSFVSPMIRRSGRSHVIFYGDLVYKLKKLKGINDFSLQFGKIISRYRRIGYNLNVMRQSACLVFNPIMVDNYAAFFNCTPVGRASDSMMAPT